MWAQDTHAQLHEALTAEGFALVPSHTKYLLYKGTLQIKSRAVPCEIHLVDTDFVDLPKLRVSDSSIADLSVAHFEGDGFYCYTLSGESIFNKYDPRSAVRSCIDMMTAALAAHLEKDLSADVAAEFPQHWRSEVVFTVELSSTGDRNLQFVDLENDGARFALVTELRAKSSCMGKIKTTEERPLVARLVEHASPLTFNRGQKQPNTIADLIVWGNSLGDSLGDKIAQAYGYEGEQLVDTVFIEAPNALIGARINISGQPPGLFDRKAGFSKMLLARQANIPIQRIGAKRVSRDILFARNLASKRMTLRGKKIAVIGCGTIGSHLAKMLAQSGAGHDGGLLSLIDNQTIEAENVGRHFLGVNRIGQNKARGCAAEIERLYPECKVRGVDVDARKDLQDLAEFDLVIDATGEEALSVVLNEWLKAQHTDGNEITALFVWLFGNALAAQGILVGKDEYACYRCLRPRHGDQWRYDPRRDPGDIEEVPGNCGAAAYLPYGVGGSVMAAGLGANMALNWANGESSPRLRTIRIDYARTRQVNDVNAPKSDGCPLCGKVGAA